MTVNRVSSHELEAAAMLCPDLECAKAEHFPDVAPFHPTVDAAVQPRYQRIFCITVRRDRWALNTPVCVDIPGKIGGNGLPVKRRRNALVV